MSRLFVQKEYKKHIIFVENYLTGVNMFDKIIL